MRPTPAPLIPAMFVILGAGCASQSTQRSAPPERVLRAPTPTTSERSVRVSPPASLNAQPLAWDDLHTALVEAAGAIALEEIVLDRLLEREAERRDVVVEQVDLEREERALLDSLAQTSSAGGETALLEELRRRRGLGPQRYRALLRRTATMRALVAPNVNVTPEAIELARTIRFGEQRRVRIITAPSLLEAQTALRAIERGDAFAEVALRLSTDASAARGGLINAFSTADPSYPAPLRNAAKNLQVGETSPPVALDSGFVIVRLEEITPPSDPRDAALIVMEDARAEHERILMTALARRLLSEAQLTIFDPALETAWRRRGPQ